VILFFIYNLVISQSDSYELNRVGIKVGRFFVPEHLVDRVFGLTILTTFTPVSNPYFSSKS